MEKKILFLALLLCYIFTCFSVALASENTLVADDIVKKALDNGLYKSPEWKALLHVKGEKSYIKDERFILSSEKFSLQNELIETINSFFESSNLGNEHPICKFPARFFWIKKKLNLDDSVFPKVKCKNFDTYLKKAPASNISLVFASEDLKNPTSMLGHIFFKFAGLNYKEIYVEHAISFYAFIDTYNPTSLLLEAFIIGMDSAYSLRPFREVLFEYLYGENRNIWLFTLDIPEYKRKLMQYHIWELKSVKTKYYFTSYNCATSVYFILAIVNPKMLEEKFLWITPRDVVKLGFKYGVIEKGKLVPSDEWYIRMLEEKVSFNDVYKIWRSFKSKNKIASLSLNNRKDDIYKFYEKELIKAYALYLYNIGKIEKGILMKVYKNLDFQKNDGYSIDISSYKNPLDTPLDSQISIGFKRKLNKDYFYLRILPVSHTIYDNNQGYMIENELKIGEIALIIGENVKIDSVYLYKMKSLIPFDVLTGGISTSAKIGFENVYNRELIPKLSLIFSYGLGLTYKFSNNLYVYNIYHLGGFYNLNCWDMFLSPELGVIFYPLRRFKVVGNYRYNYGFLSNELNNNVFSLKAVTFLSEKFAFSFGYELVFFSGIERKNYETSLIFYF